MSTLAAALFAYATLGACVIALLFVILERAAENGDPAALRAAEHIASCPARSLGYLLALGALWPSTLALLALARVAHLIDTRR